MNRIRIYALRRVEGWLRKLEGWVQEARMRCSVCETCGQNRFTGVPCVVTDSDGLKPHAKGASVSK